MKTLQSLLILFSVTLFVLSGCGQPTNSTDTSNPSESDQSSSENNGGELKIGIISQPSTLDAPMTTEAIVRDINLFQC